MRLSKGNCISNNNNSNNNKLRDSTHATLSPYRKHVHKQLYIYIYNVPDDPHSVQLGNVTTTAVSDDDLHALGPVCALVIPLKGHQMVPSQLGKCVHHMGAQKGTDVLWNKSAISGAVLEPVRAVAHASTAAWNQICFEDEFHCFKNELGINCLLIGSVWTHRSKYTYTQLGLKINAF